MSVTVRSMAFDTTDFTPAQHRAWEGLLSGTSPGRPALQRETAERWRAFLADRTAEAVTLVRSVEGRSLYLSKSKLDALDCDGRFLDQIDSPFAWTIPMVVGDLSHKAIELDLAGGRQRAPEELMRTAWDDFAASGHAAADFVGSLGGAQADELRARALRRVLEFREVFPPLPANILRAEVEMKVRLHGGAIVLNGRPDLVVGRTHATERRQILIDLKTGGRSRHHRHDMRFYALLATLKYGVAPFRVGTYYLDEADWEYEDVDDGTLEAAARTVADKARRAAELLFSCPPDSELALLAGPACNWCGRSPTCSVAAEAAAARIDAPS